MHICRTTVSIIFYLNSLYMHISSNENITVFKHSSSSFCSSLLGIRALKKTNIFSSLNPKWHSHPSQTLLLLLMSQPSPISHLLLLLNYTPPTILCGKLKLYHTFEVMTFIVILMAQSSFHPKK